MKTKQNLFVAAALMLGIATNAWGMAFVLDGEMSVKDVKKALPCAPPLVSQKVMDESAAQLQTPSHGDLEFVRTDVNEPDGILTIRRISLDNKVVCTRKISLIENIYYSAVLKMMVLESVAAPSPSFKLYKVDDTGCSLFGFTSDTPHSLGSTEAVTDILSLKTAKKCEF